jgi:glutathione peroxidase
MFERYQNMFTRFALLIILLGVISMIQAKSIYDIEVTAISGEAQTLEPYQGKVLLIVNTASKCGFTKQYDELQELYAQYGDQGLVILGFPANNFMNQEPGSNEEIADFCRLNFGVSFPMFEKISVRGKDIHPLYKHLTEKDSNPEHSGKISWNFTKFLISKDGAVINRYAPNVKPTHESVIAAIEEALQ